MSSGNAIFAENFEEEMGDVSYLLPFSSENDSVQRSTILQPKIEFTINGAKCNIKEFEVALRSNPCDVSITRFYQNRTPEKKPWRAARKYRENDSDFNAYMRSNTAMLRHWQKKGIVAIKFEGVSK
jgi:hypothetical protein